MRKRFNADPEKYLRPSRPPLNFPNSQMVQIGGNHPSARRCSANSKTCTAITREGNRHIRLPHGP